VIISDLVNLNCRVIHHNFSKNKCLPLFLRTSFNNNQSSRRVVKEDKQISKTLIIIPVPSNRIQKKRSSD